MSDELNKSLFIVEPDRSIRPAYPNWMRKVVHPELECTGPAKINLKALVLERHIVPAYKVITGLQIYDNIRDNDALDRCLSLQDGLAIQAAGVAVYRKVFSSRTVCLWKSVGQHKDFGGGLCLHVAYLTNTDNREVYIGWGCLAYDFSRPISAFHPAAGN